MNLLSKLKVAAITLLGMGMFLVCGYSVLLEGDKVSTWTTPLGMLAGFVLVTGMVLLVFALKKKGDKCSSPMKN